MKYTVDRKTWWRGQGEVSSALLRSQDGMMCCLGHVSLQCGIQKKDILGKEAPHVLSRKLRTSYPKWMFTRDLKSAAHDMLEAMTTNDNQGMSDNEREQILQAIFEKHGDTLEFIN